MRCNPREHSWLQSFAGCAALWLMGTACEGSTVEPAECSGGTGGASPNDAARPSLPSPGDGDGRESGAGGTPQSGGPEQEGGSGGNAGAGDDLLGAGAGGGASGAGGGASGAAGMDAAEGGAAGSAGNGPTILGGPFPGQPLPSDHIESPMLGYYSQWAGTGTICPDLPAADYCLYYGTPGSRPYVIGSAPGCGTHNQITEFAGFGTVLDGTWYSSLNNYVWEYELDDKYNGVKGVSPWPATWNGVLVGLELDIAEGSAPNAGIARFTVDWERRWWKGPDDGSVAIEFAPEGLDATLPAYPVVGRWRRDYGARLGLYQNGKFYLDWDGDNAWSDADQIVTFSAPGLYPVAADFTPGGGDEIALYADGLWYIDLNGSYSWDGTDGGDSNPAFGDAGSLPVVTRDGWIRDCE